MMATTYNKRFFSVLLALLMLSMLVPFAFAENTHYQTGDHIQFGTYPQTRVEESEGLKTAANSATWKSYGYYSGTGNEADGEMRTGNWMQFSDFFYGGVKYRAVKFSQYRPSFTGGAPDDNRQNANGFFPNIMYYFKYEPLTWRILNSSTGFVICENIIDSQAYQNTAYYVGFGSTDSDQYPYTDQYYQAKHSIVFASNYAASSIRDWLNHDFYETAFSDSQKAVLKTTTLNNDCFGDETFNSPETNDKIFLLSYNDIMNESYGFYSYNADHFIISMKNAIAQGTDYAQSQGLIVSGSACEGSWRLRTPGYYSGSSCSVAEDGFTGNMMPVGRTDIGIRPACCLSDLKSDISTSYSFFSGGSHKHNYTSTVTTPATCKTEGVMTYACTCGESYTEVIAIDSNAHGKLNETGNCTLCGKHIKDVEKPTEPSDEKPTDEKPAENLNFFQRIIQWFKNLFAKLFKR